MCGEIYDGTGIKSPLVQIKSKNEATSATRGKEVGIAKRHYTVSLDRLSDKQLMAELADNFTGINYGIIKDTDQLYDAASQAFQDTTEAICEAYNFARDVYQQENNDIDVFDSVEEKFREFVYNYVEGKGVKFGDNGNLKKPTDTIEEEHQPSPMLKQIMKATAEQQKQQQSQSETNSLRERSQHKI